MGERLAWIVTNMDDVLEVSLMAASVLPLLIAALIVYRERRSR